MSCSKCGAKLLDQATICFQCKTKVHYPKVPKAAAGNARLIIGIILAAAGAIILLLISNLRADDWTVTAGEVLPFQIFAFVLIAVAAVCIFTYIKNK